MRFLAPLLASVAGIELEGLTTEIKRRLLLAAILAACGTIAAVFLLVALYVVLADLWGLALAALAIAGGAVLIALVAYLVGQIGSREYRKREAENRRRREANALVTTAALGALPALLRSRFALPAAAIGAFLLMRSQRKD
jgi:small neutral amino acid transporter SnatA (MarC family)